MIQLKEIQRDYKKVKALAGINLEINAGDYISIIGKSGAGKSTLLNILAGIDVPSSGEYYFKGKKLTTNIHKLAMFRAENIGLIVQNFALINSMTVYENIALPLKYIGLSKKKMLREVHNIAEYLGIEEKLNSYPEELSGGQCQRTAIARALIRKPEILLADEPTGALDYENKELILDILRNLNKENIAIVVVTHDMDVANEADQILKMENGLFL